MNPEFIDWLADMIPGQLIMYGNAYGYECLHQTPDKTKQKIITFPEPSFQDWLMECFNREHGEKIQGEDNGN